ncbi:MAG: DUF1800 domain-containing protein [Chitinophagaceae bacterium]
MKDFSTTEELKVQHLCWRAGFGQNSDFQQKWESKNFHRLIHLTLHGEGKEHGEIKVREDLQIPLRPDFKTMTPEERKMFFMKNQQGIRQLNLDWINTMVATSHPLHEKMSLFWHGHFACRIGNVFFNQQLLQVIRENALGNFGDLLFAVSKSAAMLQFLNNQQNRKQHPNENFAREVMELFTMGRGNYTENDVKEGARAFTGWGFLPDGSFTFRPFLHDQGQKVFLGKTGNFNGDDILNILLEHPATAYFITKKLYQFFVNDATQVNEDQVKGMANLFYQSNYDIKQLMEAIFTADWFYSLSNIGARIKSPVELMVGMQRVIPVQFEKEQALILFQRILSQVLFYPPNVGGWPGGRDWIDSSTLMFRMRLPQIIYHEQTVNIQPKDMPDEMTDDQLMMKMNELIQREYANRVKTTVEWDTYIHSFSSVPMERLPLAIAGKLLVNAPRKVNRFLLNEFADNSSREQYIKTLSIDLMSTPEYQLC